jgi:hypothetical protein
VNARLSRTERDYVARDLIIKALAGNADPCDARGVLSQALEQLKTEIWCASTAYEAMGVGSSPAFAAQMLNLVSRAEALEAFCDSYLDVNFTTTTDGES